MNNSVYNIPVANLALALIPVFVVIVIYAKWSLPFKTISYALVRMLLQLILIGFVLIYIFESESPVLISSLLAFMLIMASWIAIRPLHHTTPGLYGKALLSLAVGCLTTLGLVILGVIRLTPWHEPRYLIPIAGMIFAHAMNGVSLAAERFHAETERKVAYREARAASFRAALLPTINTFFAVGLVSLPGMMTGQILAGISPLIAIRYQIMVMCMVLGSSGISAAMYLFLQRKEKSTA